jgi:hypothetical protein
MATNDDTSNPRRSPRRASRRAAAPAPEFPPPVIPPRTLEEALGNVRTLTLQLRAVLHCLSDVLQYANDPDSLMHAEVARSAAEWANMAAIELDLATLKPLIDAIRHPRSDAPSDGGSGPHLRWNLSSEGAYTRVPRMIR